MNDKKPLTNDIDSLISAGYELIKLHAWWHLADDERPLGKAPVDKGWESTTPLTLKEAKAWMDAGNNVGVRLRATDLVIDIDPRNFEDGKDSQKMLGERFSIDWDLYPCSITPSNGRHYYMRIENVGKLKKNVKDFPGIDFMSVGGQVLPPGSIHPNGLYYEWDPFSTSFPAPFAPGALVTFLMKTAPVVTTGEIDFQDLQIVLDQLDVTRFRTHDQWFRLMCACHEASGGSGEQEFISWSTSDPNYSSAGEEIRARWRSLGTGKSGNAGVGTLESVLVEHGVTDMPWRRGSAAEDFAGCENDSELTVPEDPHDPDVKLRNMSKEFFVVDENGLMRIFRQVPDLTLKRKVWTRYKKNEFIDVVRSVMMKGNYGVQIGDKIKQIPIGQYWLEEYHDKKTYQGIVFAPEINSDKTPDGRFNLWRGFAVRPSKGSWTMLQELIMDILAQGDQSYYDYIVNWLARAVQEPWTPGEVALVLKGTKGVGKSTLGRIFVRLFGAHGLQVTSPSMLVGRFNSHLRDLVALFADEAFWAGDKAGESILKGLVTESMITYEGKGTNAEVGRNCVHIIVASNADWVVPAGMDRERRFAVFQTTDTPRPHSFWVELHRQMENGGFEAMLHDLLTRDLSRFNVREVPRTDALLEQQMSTVNPIESWLIEFIGSADWDGLKPVWEDEHNVAFLADDIISCIESEYKRSGFKPGMLGRAFGMRVSRLLGPLVRRVRIKRPEDRLDISTERPWGYLFSSRDLLKQRVKQIMGADPFQAAFEDDQSYL